MDDSGIQGNETVVKDPDDAIQDVTREHVLV